jgi:hypothetical protein
MGKYDGVIRATDEAGDAVRSVIKAYHGSGADFKKFDSGKIGTGEGNQSYGYGLYFAGHEPVAKRYRDMLAQETPYSSPEEAAAEYLAINGGDTHSALQVLTDHARDPVSYGYGTPAEQAIIREARALLRSGAEIVPQERMGHMYEVEIAHPESNLLDWDAPLAGQRAGGLDVIERAAVGLDKSSRDDLLSLPRWGDKMPGGALYRSLADSYKQQLQGPLGVARDAPAMASRALLEAGVPGVRYFDGLSRRASQGTRNYVMFPGTEDSIRILRKYAIPGAVGTGVASQYGEE